MELRPVPTLAKALVDSCRTVVWPVCVLVDVVPVLIETRLTLLVVKEDEVEMMVVVGRTFVGTIMYDSFNGLSG